MSDSTHRSRNSSESSYQSSCCSSCCSGSDSDSEREISPPAKPIEKVDKPTHLDEEPVFEDLMMSDSEEAGTSSPTNLDQESEPAFDIAQLKKLVAQAEALTGKAKKRKSDKDVAEESKKRAKAKASFRRL